MSIARVLTRNLSISQTVTASATGYTESLNFRAAKGYAAILYTEELAGSSVTITQQCSLDNVTFYDPTDADGTALGEVAAALTADRYTQFSPVIAPFIRFKVVAAAGQSSVFSMKLVSME